jgi:glycosyltransferase involved in cell wall biosynthesis
MHILFLTKIFPYPPDSGVKFKTFHVLKHLCRTNKVYLVSFSENKYNQSQELKLRQFCVGVKTFYRPIISKFSLFFISSYIHSLLLIRPYVIYKFFDWRMEKYIDTILKKNNFEILYIDNIHMAQYIPKWFRGRIVYDSHEIEYLTYFSFIHESIPTLLKLLYLMESIKLYFYEKHWMSKFDFIFTISELDKATFAKMGFPINKISCLPIPFKVKRTYRENIQKPTITFIASLSWLPNRKGLEWFIENVFPLVKVKIPEIKLTVVGKDEQGFYKKYHNCKSIKFLGYAKKIRTIYKNSSVIVVPIFSGGGIRIKILDAMSHGIPVVSTSKGAEGVTLKSNKEIIIADTLEDFALGIIKILTDRKFTLNLSHRSRRFMKKYYSYNASNAVLKKLEKI